jgi:hypothetical protein
MHVLVLQAYLDKYKQQMGADAVHRQVERCMQLHKAAAADTPEPPSLDAVQPSGATGTQVAAQHAVLDLPEISASPTRESQQILGLPIWSTQQAADSSSPDRRAVKASSDVAQVHAVAEYRGTWEEAPEAERSSAAVSKLSVFERRVCFALALWLEPSSIGAVSVFAASRSTKSYCACTFWALDACSTCCD